MPSLSNCIFTSGHLIFEKNREISHIREEELCKYVINVQLIVVLFAAEFHSKTDVTIQCYFAL
jgi:hypothetical protein